MTSPRFIFIIPYRDRAEHKNFFDIYIKYLLEDVSDSDYEIVFVRQANLLPFNRGAMKNLGFLYAKEKYPNHYKSQNFIFNDIDTLPNVKNLLDYNVRSGEIKHFYGYKFALGGIFSIKGEDFENINGFPNYWGWGFEDNVIYKRALKAGIVINRSQFYTIGSREILHFVDSLNKHMDRRALEMEINKYSIEKDGINTLKEIEKKYDDVTGFLDVLHFKGNYSSNVISSIQHSVFSGPKINVRTCKKHKMQKMQWL